MEREFLMRFLVVTTRFLVVLTTRNEVKNQGGQQRVEKEFMTRFLLVTTRFLTVLTARNEVKNHGGYQMEREFLTRFLLVTTRFLAVLTTRNEVKNQGAIREFKKEFMTSSSLAPRDSSWCSPRGTRLKIMGGIRWKENS